MLATELRAGREELVREHRSGYGEIMKNRAWTIMMNSRGGGVSLWETPTGNKVSRGLSLDIG